MTDPLTIVCFSWNADGLRLCETLSQAKADSARTGFRGFITQRQPCVVPDFFEGIRDIIRNKRPGLIVIVTEDEAATDTYFHAEFLPRAMTEMNYTLLKRNKLEGVSQPNKGRIITGNPKDGALRVSIYAQNSVYYQFRAEEKDLNKFFGDDGQVTETCKQENQKSGAIASYVWHETYGKFVFIATHLATGANELGTSKNLTYDQYRVTIRAVNAICLVNLLSKFVDNLANNQKPNHVFLLGDLNYDIVIPNKTDAEVVKDISQMSGAGTFKSLQQYDELKNALKEAPLNDFKEGISNEGPTFLPTWRLAKRRDDSCIMEDGAKISTGCFSGVGDHSGGVGWHDRILYKEATTSNYIAHCISYSRIDIGNIHQSTHAGIIGVYELRPLSG